MDAIEASEAPVTFSHDGSFTLASHSFQARRLRKDEELLACARKGGIIGITAVPNRFSNDPEQTIDCVLDHYDYMVNLVRHRPRRHRHRHQHRGLGGRGRGGDGSAGSDAGALHERAGVAGRRQEHRAGADRAGVLGRGRSEDSRGRMRWRFSGG